MKEAIFRLCSRQVQCSLCWVAVPKETKCGFFLKEKYFFPILNTRPHNKNSLGPSMPLKLDFMLPRVRHDEVSQQY